MIHRIEFGQRHVECRRNLVPIRIGLVSKPFIHRGSLLFAAAAEFRAQGLCSDIARGAMQPTRQHRTSCDLWRVLRKGKKAECVTSSAR